MKTLAIIGPTASGKTDLAHTLARRNNACVLSCDSLSVFKTIDIASAKPTLRERAGIDYFGLDRVAPCGRFGAEDFAAEFLRAKAFCEAADRPLIIVGGTGFYLKTSRTASLRFPTFPAPQPIGWPPCWKTPQRPMPNSPGSILCTPVAFKALIAIASKRGF